MSFSYEPGAAPDISDTTRVRFHTGQTVEDESLLSDEEISFALAETMAWRLAVILCLQLVIQKMSRPNFTADWLKMDYAGAKAGYVLMLSEKRAEFGLQTILTATSVAVYRSDSLQTEAPEGW